MTGNNDTRKANTYGSSFVLEADGRCVKTTNTEADTMVVTTRMCKTLAYRKYSTDKKTPRAIPMAIEKIILNSTMYFIRIIEVTVASEGTVAEISSHDGHEGIDVIEFGDSYETTKDNTATRSASDGTEHQLRFSKHKTAQELWAAILKTFGGNEATKKTMKNLLKQQSDLDTMSLDDLYNHLKVYESKGQKKSESNSQNMAFISLAKHNSGNEEVNIASVSTASTNVSTASANIRAASISQDTAYGYQMEYGTSKHEADRYWKKTGKKITIQGTDVARFDKSKFECFNCHKMGHFAKECRAPRNQDRGMRDNYRQWSKVKEQTLKAMMEIDEVVWDWNYMVNDEENHALVAHEEAPTEFALMAKTSAKSEVFDNSLCSKAYKKNTDSLNSKIIDLDDKLYDAKNMIYHYKLGLAQVKARLAALRNQEVKYCEKIIILEFKTESRANYIESLTKELELIKKEKEGLDSKLAGFQTASKDLDSLLESQRLDKNKEGPVPTVESSPDDAQNRNPSVNATEASPSTISPKPFIKFVKAIDRSTETKTTKVETAKPTVKYAATYNKPSKSSNVRGNQRN
uniref:CCHC-type domain-containing protein n=1 Tax=Tanacetum cinerariifolium TaxID=118510 RepID=A0A699I9G9_TANCI|nr:hypothetical protein [Tanacetum cinerariifolium]